MRRVVARPPTVTGKGREQVDDDAVVVAGVERHVVAPRRGHRAHHVERAVAVERRDLHRHQVRHRLGEVAPEAVAERAPAHGGLQVEAEHGEHLAHRAAVAHERVLGRVGEGAERDERAVVAEGARHLGLVHRLARVADDARDEGEGARAAVGAGGAGEPVARRLAGQLEHGAVEPDLRVVDGELRGVHPHRHAAGAGLHVVAVRARWWRSSSARVGVSASGWAGMT
jgi:hypothetical protein